MKKLALIGCGGIGSYHLGHFLDYTDVELAGFCDIISERAQAFVDRAGCGRAFTDFKEMYDEINPDMVFICVPPYAHGEIEFETIRRHIPFFVEKPLALDVDLARKINALVTQAGLITACGFQCRYSNIVDDTKAFARDHEILFVNCNRFGGVPSTEWWGDKSLSGGQIVEQTIHNFDMIRYIIGDPVEVYTIGATGFVSGYKNYNTDDMTVTSVRFASGALAALSTGCFATDGSASDNKITFTARDSRLDHYIIDKAVIYGAAPKATEETVDIVVKGDGAMRSTADGIVIKDDGLAGVRCDRTFVDAVLTGDASKIRSPYADALRSVEFTLACNLSQEISSPVEL